MPDVSCALNPQNLGFDERANMRPPFIDWTFLLGMEPRPSLEGEEPDSDDEPPPDSGPPGSGAVITEYD